MISSLMLKPRTCCIQKLKCLEQKLKRWCSKKLIFFILIPFYCQFHQCQAYRVSHSKEDKVFLLWPGYRFWFFLVFWVVCVNEIGTFMSRVSVQGVKSLGGHFACLCRGFEFYEVKKKILFFKKKMEILLHF